jgi:RNA polymerase sigma-70 factor (ECF subfamily)
MQDAFVKGYQALGSFDPEKDFYPWISTIARNLAVNYIKRESRTQSSAEIETMLKTIPDKSDNPMENMIVKENDHRFSVAVAALPEKYRTVFVMRMIEKMSYEEIAAKLNISRGTVDSRLFRARQKLVELLKDYL